MDNIQIPNTNITTDNKELLLEINKFKIEIIDTINFVFSKQNEDKTKPNDIQQEYDTTHEHRSSGECSKYGLDYSNSKHHKGTRTFTARYWRMLSKSLTCSPNENTIRSASAGGFRTLATKHGLQKKNNTKPLKWVKKLVWTQQNTIN